MVESPVGADTFLRGNVFFRSGRVLNGTRVKKQPDWIPWYPARILSDPDYLALPFKFRCVYRELLDFIGMKGEIEWNIATLKRQYKIEGELEGEPEESWLERVKALLQVRKKNGREFVTHWIMTEARDRYFRKVEQAQEAANIRWKKEKEEKRALSERYASAYAESSERNASPSNSLSSSLSSDLDLPIQDLAKGKIINKAEPKKRDEDELLGLRWIEAQPAHIQEQVAKAINVARDTRQGGKMSKRLVRRIFGRLAKYPIETVLDAVEVYTTEHQGKDERYFLGIVRRMHKERVR